MGHHRRPDMVRGDGGEGLRRRAGADRARPGSGAGARLRFPCRRKPRDSGLRMAVHTIRPETNQHFEILGLRISPEITGMSHTFAVEGKQVRITLPVIPEDAPKGAFPSWTGNHSIRYAGFNIV